MTYPKNRLLTVAQVIEVTTCKKTKLYDLVKTGELRLIKIGRKTVFSEEEIHNWIADRVAASRATSKN